MEPCARHPEKQARYQCLKHGVWMCAECLGCRDPALYCKHRSGCLVWYLEKHSEPSVAEAQAPEDQEWIEGRLA